MSCPKPLIRAETYQSYRNKKGGISWKEEWLPRDYYDELLTNNMLNTIIPAVYRKVDQVPCGQCIECRLQYTREWATRCMLEKEFGYHEIFDEEGNPLDIGHKYPDNTCWFLTLTYKDEYLPSQSCVNQLTGEVYKGFTVKKEDMQLFWKRVRNKKKWKNLQIKYLNCMEYGSQTHRPHGHAIVFNLPLDITKFKKMGVNDWGDPYWTTDELDNCWYDDETEKPLGHITIGRVTWKSASYVARYNLKKLLNKDNDEWYHLQGIQPEYVSMSNNIGLEYLTQNWDKVVATDSVPVINPKSGELAKAPKRFMRIIEEIDHDMYKRIKHERRISGISQEYIRRQNTDLTPEERRKQSEERMKQVIHDLRGL